MKNHKKLIFMLFMIFFAANTSCDKFTGDTDSISGAWRCNEESGAGGFRQYSVSIYRAGKDFDSTYFIINNFHNLGFEIDTYVQLKDTVVAIRDITINNISGEGHVSKNFKSIDWNYSVGGSFVRAYYYKK